MEYRIAIAKQISPLLKSLRKKCGLTQKELGKRFGISQRMVALIEASPEKARFERILQILSELDADLVIRERNSKPEKDSSVDVEPW